MNKLLTVFLVLMTVPFQGQGQSKDESAIKADIVKLWKDAAQRKMDRNNLDPEHNMIAYSTGGLWEDLSAEEMAKSIVGGPNTFALRPYHINVRFLGSKKDVAYVSYYLVGNILRGNTVVVSNYRTRISQVSEKRGGKWITVGNHASPLYGGSGIVFE